MDIHSFSYYIKKYVFIEPSWNGHRKLFNKAFSHKILKSYIPIFVKESNNLIREIDLTITEGKEMDLWMLLQESTLKISTGK